MVGLSVAKDKKYIGGLSGKDNNSTQICTHEVHATPNGTQMIELSP